jgi:hypothetical protein
MAKSEAMRPNSPIGATLIDPRRTLHERDGPTDFLVHQAPAIAAKVRRVLLINSWRFGSGKST